MWQDFVFTAGNVIFIVALIPTILSKEKPPLSTSVPTAAVLIAFAVTYGSLHLWYALTSATVTALAWSIIALQRLLRRPSDRP